MEFVKREIVYVVSLSVLICELIVASVMFANYNKGVKAEREIYEEQIIEYSDSLVYYKQLANDKSNEIKANNAIDSLNAQVRYYKERLYLAEFKLERIRYYNDIAGKNNNLKYLRGWINRVLE